MQGNTAVDQAEIGQPEGKTQYSDYAERYYEAAREGSTSLSASEYVAVVEGEFVCMGQCNLYIAAAKDPQLKEAITVYLDDVCYPNLHEMKHILEDDGYMLPAPLEEATTPDEVPDIDTNAVNDRMITIAQWFGTRGFMTLWNNFAAMSQNTDVRAAFLRNYHRADRWHVAYHRMAVEKGHMMPMPTMDAKGMMRTTMMGG
jgi:hypothetical protein